MDAHKKKMVAPIIIAAVILLYYVIFFIVCLCIPLPLILRLLAGLIPAALGGVCIYVLVERIKEIRSGEEDDLGKY